MRPITTSLLVLEVFALAASSAFAAEQASPSVGPWPGWHSHWPGLWWICPLMMLFMFAFFAVVFLALRRHRGDWRPPWRWISEQLESQQTYEGYRGATPESALDILNKRYARGEIEKAEYEEKKTAVTPAGN